MLSDWSNAQAWTIKWQLIFVAHHAMTILTTTKITYPLHSIILHSPKISCRLSHSKFNQTTTMKTRLLDWIRDKIFRGERHTWFHKAFSLFTRTKLRLQENVLQLPWGLQPPQPSKKPNTIQEWAAFLTHSICHKLIASPPCSIYKIYCNNLSRLLQKCCPTSTQMHMAIKTPLGSHSTHINPNSKYFAVPLLSPNLPT